MGISVELFKLLGMIFSTYIALHFYTTLSNLIQRRFLPDEMPLEFMDFIIFISLIALGYLCFVGLRSIFSRFIELKAIPKINQFLGLFLGIGRGFLVVGLISFTLVISSVSYLSNSVKHSYLGSRAFVILPGTYGWVWSNITSKFSAREKFNPTVTLVSERFNRK